MTYKSISKSTLKKYFYKLLTTVKQKSFLFTKLTNKYFFFILETEVDIDLD